MKPLQAGHLSMILQSLFGTQRGWIADFDWQDVRRRFLEPIPDGKYQGFTIASGCPILFRILSPIGKTRTNRSALQEDDEELGLEEFMPGAKKPANCDWNELTLTVEHISRNRWTLWHRVRDRSPVEGDAPACGSSR